MRDSLTLIFKHFHNSIISLSEKFYQQLGRKTYVTPTSYLELIGSFERLIKKKKDEIMKAKMRLAICLITEFKIDNNRSLINYSWQIS